MGLMWFWAVAVGFGEQLRAGCLGSVGGGWGFLVKKGRMDSVRWDERVTVMAGMGMDG